MEKYYNAIVKWATDRNIINGATQVSQYTKLMEEFGELASGISRSNKDKIIDAIGDCTVVSIILLQQLQYKYNPFDHIIFIPFDKESVTSHHVLLDCARDLGEISYYLNRVESFGKDRVSSCIISFMERLASVAYLYDTSLKEAIGAAFQEIEFRRGVMLNGIFIKEEDIPSTIKQLSEEYDAINNKLLDNIQQFGENPNISDIAKSEKSSENLQKKAMQLALDIDALKRNL